MTEPHPMSRDIDRLVCTLPEPVRQTLADLHGAPRQAAETTIALLPFGRRALLEAVKVTYTVTVESTDGGAARQKVTLTDWGRRVIDACANADERPADLDHEQARTSELRAQLSALPPGR